MTNPRPVDIEVAVVDTVEAFAAMESEWNELLAASTSENIFLSWDWLFTWFAQFAGRARLRIITVRQGRELIAIAPMMMSPARVLALRPCRRIEFLGIGDVGSDYFEFIVRCGWEAEAKHAIARALAALRGVVDLPRLSGPTMAEDVAASLGSEGWTVTRDVAGTCPYIPLEGATWESYLARLGSGHRHTLARRQRALHAHGTVSFEWVRTDEERAAALADLIRLHNERWVGRGGSTAFHTPELVAFHHAVTRRMLDRGWLRLGLLRLNGDVTAAVYCLRYGSRFSFYQAGFDARFSRFSAGLVAVGMAIRAAIAEGAGDYDFLHGDEEYKRHWTRDARALHKLELYPPHALGGLSRLASKSERAARRFARQLLTRFGTGKGTHVDQPSRQRSVVPTAP